MSFEQNHEKLFFVSSILGSLGALLLIVGSILIFTRGGFGIQSLVILIFIINLFISCLVAFSGTLPNVRFTFADERLPLLSFLALFFTPFVLISNSTTPLYYFVETNLTSGNFGAVHHLSLVGITFLFLSFMFFSWLFFWKLSQRFSQEIALEIPLASFLGLLASSISIITIVCLIIGMVLPAATSTSSSLLMAAGGGNQLSVSALTFLLYLVSIVITATIVFLSHFERVNLPRTDTPLLFMLFTVVALPGYAPPSASEAIWSSPVYELLEYGLYIYNDLTTSGWVLIVSTLLVVFALFLVVVSFFLKMSASMEEEEQALPMTGISTSPFVTENDTKDSPPTADSLSSQPLTAEPLARTFSQTAAQGREQSAPPTMPASTSQLYAAPPTGSQNSFSNFNIAVQEPVALHERDSREEEEKPTCPFCGKELSYIKEYQRWYCYNCRQYL